MLTPRVIIVVSNYSLLALLDIVLRALQPLFYTMNIPDGGLGFSLPTIGMCLGAFGLFSGLLQIIVFPHIHNRFGTKRLFITSVAPCIPMFALFPLMNLSARSTGINAVIWVALTLQMILDGILNMGLSLCIFSESTSVS